MVVDNKYESAIVFEGIPSMTHSLTYLLTHLLIDDVHLVDDFKSVLISNLESLKKNNQSNDYDVILLGHSLTHSCLLTHSC